MSRNYDSQNQNRNRQYAYGTLGSDCCSQTTALTSNTIFLSPLDDIYNKKYTNDILLYPGHEEDNNLNKNLKENVIEKKILNLQNKKSCNSCSKY